VRGDLYATYPRAREQTSGSPTTSSDFEDWEYFIKSVLIPEFSARLDAYRARQQAWVTTTALGRPDLEPHATRLQRAWRTANFGHWFSNLDTSIKANSLHVSEGAEANWTVRGLLAQFQKGPLMLEKLSALLAEAEAAAQEPDPREATVAALEGQVDALAAAVATGRDKAARLQELEEAERELERLRWAYGRE
jgi:hypothetical protein